MLKLVISNSTTVATKILEGGRCHKSHLNPPLWLNNVVKVVIWLISTETVLNTSLKEIKTLIKHFSLDVAMETMLSP